MIHSTRIKELSNSATLKLSLTYWVLIMVMSISFSIVFYRASYRQLGRQAPPNGFIGTSQQSNPASQVEFRKEIDSFIRKRIEEGREELLMKLLALNGLAAVLGAALGYGLARRTLKPIEDSMEAQARFVSDASHELRTPLTALQTTNEVALRKPKLSNTEARQLIQENIKEVAKLKSLSEGLLGLLKQDAGILELKEVNLQDIISDSVNIIIPIAQTKDISLDDKVPPLQVLADYQALSRLMTILLENAVQYSPNDRQIVISAERRQKVTLIHVKDHGVGIKASDIPHLFDRFYRADTSRSKLDNEGYGLGLSIAQRIAHQHGGNIFVVSTPGEGSIFTVKLKST